MERFGAKIKKPAPAERSVAGYMGMSPRERARNFNLEFGRHMVRAAELLTPKEHLPKLVNVDKIHTIPLLFDVRDGSCKAIIDHDKLDTLYSQLMFSRMGDHHFFKRLGELASNCEDKLDEKTNYFVGSMPDGHRGIFYNKLLSELEPMLGILGVKHDPRKVLDHLLLYEKARRDEYNLKTSDAYTAGFHGGSSSSNGIMLTTHHAFTPKKFSENIDLLTVFHEIGHNSVERTRPTYPELNVNELYAHAFSYYSLFDRVMEREPERKKEFMRWMDRDILTNMAGNRREGGESGDAHAWALSKLQGLLKENEGDMERTMKAVRKVVYA